MFRFLVHVLVLFYSVCQLSLVSCRLSLVRCSVCYFHFVVVVVAVACRFYFHFDFFYCYRRSALSTLLFDNNWHAIQHPPTTLSTLPWLLATYTSAQSLPLPILESNSQVTLKLLAYACCICVRKFEYPAYFEVPCALSLAWKGIVPICPFQLQTRLNIPFFYQNVGYLTVYYWRLCVLVYEIVYTWLGTCFTQCLQVCLSFKLTDHFLQGIH